MRRLILIAATAAGLAAAASPAAAIETIDCSKDRNTAERTICSSRHLQVLDARVTEAYADIMLDSNVKSSTKHLVYVSQLEFLRNRDACGRDTECLADVMQRRASRIDFYR